MKKAQFLKQLNKTGHQDLNFHLLDQDARISSIYGKHGLGMSICNELGFKRRANYDHTNNYCKFVFYFFSNLIVS